MQKFLSNALFWAAFVVYVITVIVLLAWLVGAATDTQVIVAMLINLTVEFEARWNER